MLNQDAKKENLQSRHYFIYEKLLEMTKETPIEIQQSLSNELLSSLAASLLDGTVFEIVNNLHEMQQITERNLFNERTKTSNQYTNQRNQLLKRHQTTEKACETKPHHLNILVAANKRELEAFDKRMNDELHRIDMKIINEFDTKLSEQQQTLNQAGVFGFVESKDPKEIKKQMFLLSFIRRLSNMSIK